MNYDKYISKADQLGKAVIRYTIDRRKIQQNNMYSGEYRQKLLDELKTKTDGEIEDYIKSIVSEAEIDIERAKKAVTPVTNSWEERSYWAIAMAQELAGLDGKAILAKYDQVVKQENSLMRLEFERLATDTLSKNDIVSLELFNQKQVEYMSAEEREARTDMLAGKRMADAAIGMKGIANQALRWDEAGQEITNYLEALPDTVTDVQRSVNAAGASQILGLE